MRRIMFLILAVVELRNMEKIDARREWNENNAAPDDSMAPNSTEESSEAGRITGVE